MILSSEGFADFNCSLDMVVFLVVLVSFAVLFVCLFVCAFVRSFVCLTGRLVGVVLLPEVNVCI